jgi:heat shock protein HslJ
MNHMELFMRRPIFACAILAVVTGASPALSQGEFPFERDLVLEARAMKGSKRLPVLAIEQNGRAQLDLWCKRGRGMAAIDGGAMTITVGDMKDEPCTPERAQADADMIEALGGVTGWSVRGDMVTLTGAKTMKFRAATN